jgi:hypothetical protein
LRLQPVGALLMSKDGPREIYCPWCLAAGRRRYLGTLDGDYFKAPPCSCGFQLELTQRRKVPRRVDRIEIRA